MDSYSNNDYSIKSLKNSEPDSFSICFDLPKYLTHL